MITMYGFIPAWGLPDVSPFVSKIDCFMRMAGIPFQLVTLPQGDLTRTPKGKLPVIDDDGVIVSDTVLIEMYLNRKFGDPLDAHLSREQRAIGVAFSRMFDDSFYWFLVQMRYRRDEDFAVYDPIWETFLAFVPPEARAAPVREFRERLLRQFFHSGKGRNSEKEVETMAFQQFDAIADFLGDKPYLFGDRPSTVDAAAYASLSHAMFVPFPSPIGRYGNSKPSLLAYVNRIQAQFYPELGVTRAVRQ
jgi:glutathione S-transferase